MSTRFTSTESAIPAAIPAPRAPLDDCAEPPPTVRRAAPASEAPVAGIPAPARVAVLLSQASRSLGDAEHATRPEDRYVAAYIAALRAATAVVVAEGPRPENRPASVWTLLARAAPELGEWADGFASCSKRSATAQAGVRGRISASDAQRLLTLTVEFLGIVGRRFSGVTP